MKRLFFAFVCALFIVGCASDSATDTDSTADTTAAMTDDGYVPSDDDEIIEEEFTVDPNGPLAGMANFPTHWERLSKFNEELVLTEPCDAANQSFSFSKEGDKYIFAYNIGQEVIDYTIVSCKTIASEEAEIEYHFDLNSNFSDDTGIGLICLWEPDTEIAVWEFVGANGPILFTPLEWSSYYPMVKEPCLMCWDERCSWEQDFFDGYGMGMLKVSMSSPVKVYKNMGDDAPIGQIPHTSDERPEWLQPSVYFPEYELCHIVVQEINEGWYKVVVDEALAESYWIQKGPGVDFLDWDNYVLSALSVDRIDPTKNLLRPRPGYTGEEYVFQGTDCFAPVKVVGEWLQVRWEPELCGEEVQPAFETAWIKWRDHSSVVLDFAWIM